MDVDSRKLLPDAFPEARYAGFFVLPDKTGVYYARMVKERNRVFFHKMGSDTAQDAELFGADIPANKILSARVSEDGLYLLINVAQFGAGNPSEIYVKNLGANGPIVPITKDLGGVMTLFPLTRSVEAAKTPPKGVNLQPLASTSAQSWGETDRAVFQRGEAKHDPGEKMGPLPVAIVATIDPQATAKAESKPEGVEDKKPSKARIVVVGTADFASNQFLGAQGNRDFFLNVVSWLAEQEDLISIRPKDTRQNPIILTSAQSNLVLWLPLAVLPGAVLIGGIMVVVHRRGLK